MHFSLLTQHNLALWNIFLLYKVALKYIWLSCNDCILFLISDIPSFKVSSSLAWTTGINNLLVSVSSLLFVTGAGIVLLNHTSTVVIVTCVVGILWFPFPPEWNVIWNLLWNTEAAPLCGSGRGCGQGPGTLSLSPEIIHLVDLDQFRSSRGRPQDPLEPVWSMSTLKHTAQFLQPPPQLSSRTASTAESSLWTPPLPRLPLFFWNALHLVSIQWPPLIFWEGLQMSLSLRTITTSLGRAWSTLCDLPARLRVTVYYLILQFLKCICITRHSALREPMSYWGMFPHILSPSLVLICSRL